MNSPRLVFRLGFLVGLCALGLSACGGDSSPSSASTPPPPTASYTLTATALNPSSLTAGGKATATITVTPASGYTGSVSLACSVAGGSPEPSCAFSKSTVTITSSSPATATLTAATSSSTPAGHYTISVTAHDTTNLAPSNGGLALTLTASAPVATANYTLTATALNPNSLTSGGTSTSTVTVTPSHGYTGSVSLSCAVTGGTPNPSCSFSKSAVTIASTSPVTSTLTVTTSSGTPGGHYTVSVAAHDTKSLAPSNGGIALSLTAAAVIQHIVVIFQENRTPDNLFHDPVLIARGADIASSGTNSLGQTVQLVSIDLGTVGSNPQDYDLGHGHKSFVDMYDGGKMDGADLTGCYSAPQVLCAPNSHPNAQFKYVVASDVAPYFAMAEQYTFGDRMFQTNEGPSFPAHQFILGGTSAPTATSPLFDAENPVNRGGGPAGCIAPLTETVVMINADGSESASPPEYPCFEHPTLSDLLETAGVTWRYYTPSAGSIWTAPTAINHICQPQAINSSGRLGCSGPEWTGNVVIPQTQVLTDITSGNLAQVSWVIPDGLASDHALTTDGTGPSWVASVVNAIGNSPYWANTAIIITWDDWGGWFDHVEPKVINDGVSWGSGYVYGFRVPLIVMSPYAKTAYISHVNHDFGSVLKFVETTFKLPSLGYADAPADDLSDCFNMTQSPVTFKTIQAPLGASYFLSDTRPPTDPDDD